MEVVKEVKTADEILKDRLQGIYFIRPDETFNRVISAMEEFASIQTSELKANNEELHRQRAALHLVASELKAENERLRNDLLDALDLKQGKGPTALSILKAENERLKLLLNEGMEEAFIAGKNADEWDQMCGWIQHYTYSDWIEKWRKTNAIKKITPMKKPIRTQPQFETPNDKALTGLSVIVGGFVVFLLFICSLLAMGAAAYLGQKYDF